MKRNIIALFIVIFTVIVFFSPIWGKKVGIFFDDVATYAFPNAVFQARCLQQGIFPLWEPHTYCGAYPFYLRIDASPFYPLQILIGMFGSLNNSTSAYRSLIIWPIIAHYIIAAVGAFILGRFGLRLNRIGSGVMALTFALSISLIGGMLNPPVLYSQAWFPWLVAAIVLYTRHGKSRYLVGGALICALFFPIWPVLTFHGIFIMAVFGAVIILQRLIRRRISSACRLAAGWFAMLMAGLLLSSAYWFSLREGIHYIHLTYPMNLDFVTAGPSSVPLRYWVSLLVPELFNAVNFEHVWGVAREHKLWWCEACLTRGFWLLLLGILGVWASLCRQGIESRIRIWGVTGAGLIVLGLLLMTGRHTPVFAALYRICPLFRLPYATRWHTLYTFGLSIVAGIGAFHLSEKKAVGSVLSRKRMVGYGLIASAVIITVLIRSVMIAEKGPDVGWFVSNPLFYWMLSLVILLFLSVYFRPRFTGLAIIFLAMLDLFYFGARTAYLPMGITWETEQKPVIGPTRSELYTAGSAALKATRDSIHRIGFYRSHFDNVALEEGDFSLLGVATKPMFPRMLELLRRICSGFPYQLTVRNYNTRLPANFAVRDWWLNRPDSPRPGWQDKGALGLMGLFHFVDFSAVPRVYTLDTWKYASPAEQKEALIYEDMRRLVRCGPEVTGILKQPGPTDVEHFNTLQQLNRIGELGVDNPNELRVKVKVSKPSWLVVTDAWHPGWKATDNGRPVPIYRVNYIQRGIWMEKGEHDIIMKFAPVWWRSARWLTIAGVSVCLLLIPLGHVLAPAKNKEE